MRSLTALAVLLTVLLTPLAASAFPSPTLAPPLPVLSYDRAEAVYLKLDTAWDRTPDAAKTPVFTDPAGANIWVNEILPYFVSEGITTLDDLKPPSSVTFRFYPDPDYAFHVLGTTGLCSTDVELNQRLITPGDGWMAEDLQLVVLTHELAHVQGVCASGTALNDEQSAQLISWEVDAAMANSGCAQCRASLLADLRGRALGMVEEAARAEGREADLAVLEATTLSPAEQAARARSERQWATGDQDELQRILTNYYTIPMAAWVTALDAHQTHIDGVQLPINPFQQYLPPQQAKPLVIDDLASFWSNL